jgi:hypothetical protein
MDRPALITLTTLALVSIGPHIPVFFNGHLGEQDTARLMNDALLWAKGGVRLFELSEYRYLTSPGYIVLVRALFELPFVSSKWVAPLLNALNPIACGAAVLAAYALFRHYLDHRAAFWAAVVLPFIPAFWIGGMYAFPSALALAAMLMALVTLSGQDTDAISSVKQSALAVLLLTVSIMLKADIYLSTIAAPLIYFHQRPVSLQSISKLTLMLALPVGVLLTSALALMPDAPNLIEFARQWNEQYAVQPPRVFSSIAPASWLRSFGFVTLTATAAGVAAALVRGRRLGPSLVIVWLVPPLAFWSTRPFDSARHHLPSTVPAAMGVGFALNALPAPFQAPAGVLILGLNYWAFPPSASTVFPSGRLLASAALVRQRVARNHEFAIRFQKTRDACKAVVGTNTNPYVDYEVLLGSSRVLEVSRGRRLGFDTFEYVLSEGGRRIRAASVIVDHEDSAGPVADRYRAAGYAVHSLQYRIPGSGASSPREQCMPIPFEYRGAPAVYSAER